MQSKSNYNLAAAALAAARSVLIATHVRPDGDAIGSAIGLLRVLRALGRTAELALFDPLPARYAFLAEGLSVRQWGRDYGPKQADLTDVLCVVDTCSRQQLEPIATYLTECRQKKVVLDHHQTRDPVGDVEVIDPTAGAAAQMVTCLADTAGWTIDAAAATALFVGLATDTGWFRYSNATPDVFACAARLIERGAEPNVLYERIYLSDPPERLRLIGRLLDGMTLHADGRLAVLKLTRRAMQETGATEAMTEDVINEANRIGSVVAVVLCAETEGGPIRVSLRSKRDIDVAAIAARHGGGGHQRAAGARIAGPIDDVASMLARTIEEELSRAARTTH